jgi:hypothetical protein
MNLPNYFIADLPAEHAVTPTLVTEACQTRKQREQYRPRHRRIVGLLSATAQSWLERDNPFRRLALERGVTETDSANQRRARPDASSNHSRPTI